MSNNKLYKIAVGFLLSGEAEKLARLCALQVLTTKPDVKKTRKMYNLLFDTA